MRPSDTGRSVESSGAAVASEDAAPPDRLAADWGSAGIPAGEGTVELCAASTDGRDAVPPWAGTLAAIADSTTGRRKVMIGLH
jgi:hypothetical protein